METYDFLQKQIGHVKESLEKIIPGMMHLKDSGKLGESIDLVNFCLKDILNMNIDEITNNPQENIIANIISDTKFTNNNLDMLADLFFQTAKVLEIQMEKELAKRLFNRSLSIYLYLLKAERDFPYERHLRIKELKEIVLK